MINRKQFLQRIGLASGFMFMSPALLLQSCTYIPRIRTGLSDQDIPLLDEIGETILPSTDACPGAKAAEIGTYMITMVQDCFEPEEKNIFIEGLNILDQDCAKTYNKAFEQLKPAQKLERMQSLQEEALVLALEQEEMPEKLPHYFDLFKRLTVSGYITSEIGMTQAREYRPVPGGYSGCLDYGRGQKPWAT